MGKADGEMRAEGAGPQAALREAVAQADRRQRDRWRTFYAPESFALPDVRREPYFAGLVTAKLEEVRRHYRGGRTLDLGCGAGHYALALADVMEEIVGIDFNPEMIRAAADNARDRGRGNLRFVVANARHVPLPAASVRMVYSFALLYTVPAVEQVIAEVARVLAPGGTAVLEFGALYSLNTIVCRHMEHTAKPYHMPVRKIQAGLRQCGLQIGKHRAFQILPYWGTRPLWLLPLLLPVWKRLAAVRVAGRMLDEWASSLPGLRRVAFRHLITCRKEN